MSELYESRTGVPRVLLGELAHKECPRARHVSSSKRAEGGGRVWLSKAERKGSLPLAIDVERLGRQVKLSQNRSAENAARVVATLSERDPTLAAHVSRTLSDRTKTLR